MYSVTSWQFFLILVGSLCAFILSYSFCRWVLVRPKIQVLYESSPYPKPLPSLEPMPTHPEKVLDWYKKHVYWDPTVPKPERIELLHQYNVNKKKTRRANGKNTHTLSPQPSTLNP
ncbi:hypothetical protein DER45DRAFT_549499 [Fusarium avenaceum]|nr:hypothetical protein DER45DRAFT_549499 [Fusarium avenaceum]